MWETILVHATNTQGVDRKSSEDFGERLGALGLHYFDLDCTNSKARINCFHSDFPPTLIGLFCVMDEERI